LFAGKLLPGSIFENRSEEVVFFNADYLSKGVDDLRKDSIQSPVNSLFLNKATVGLTYAGQNYFTAFSPIILFFTGEVLRNHGLFFLIDIPLMILGVLFLYSHHRKIFLYLMGIVAIAPLATAVSLNGQTLLNRSFLLLPMFLIFISFGLMQGFQYASRYVHRSIIFIMLFGVYMVSYANFIFIYFLQIPIHEHSFYQTSTRVLANYIHFEKDKSTSIEVISKEPRQIFLETLLFSPNAIQEQLLKKGETLVSKDKYSIDTVSFVSDCPKTISKSTVYLVEKDRVDCMKGMSEDFIIINQLDAGVEYYIVNGKTCIGQNLTRWRNPHLFSDYSIEKLSENIFCERWIAKP